MVTDDNFWEIKPVRMLTWIEDETTGFVVLQKPRFKSQRLNRFLKPIMRGEYIQVKLDEIGTAVWKRCDGELSLKEIAAQVEQLFGEKVRPLEERFKSFMKQLFRNELLMVRSEVSMELP